MTLIFLKKRVYYSWKRLEIGLSEKSFSHFKLNPTEQWRCNSKEPGRKAEYPKNDLCVSKNPDLGLMLSQNKRVTEQFHDILKFPPGVPMSW